jgi:hypothetical protein
VGSQIEDFLMKFRKNFAYLALTGFIALIFATNSLAEEKKAKSNLTFLNQNTILEPVYNDLNSGEHVFARYGFNGIGFVIIDSIGSTKTKKVEGIDLPPSDGDIDVIIVSEKKEDGETNENYVVSEVFYRFNNKDFQKYIKKNNLEGAILPDSNIGVMDNLTLNLERTQLYEIQDIGQYLIISHLFNSLNGVYRSVLPSIIDIAYGKMPVLDRKRINEQERKSILGMLNYDFL